MNLAVRPNVIPRHFPMARFNLKDARFVKAIVNVKDAPRPGRPSVVFAGRSNVGKSSVINSLARRRGLARTSNAPGRTQTITYFDVGGEYYLIDLPGYGYAKVPAAIRDNWGPMIEKFIEGADGIRLVVILLDIRREPTEDDIQLVEWLQHMGLPYIFALNKADKIGRSALPARLDAVRRRLGLKPRMPLVPFSATTGLGRDELAKAIGHVLDTKGKPAESGAIRAIGAGDDEDEVG